MRQQDRAERPRPAPAVDHGAHKLGAGCDHPGRCVVESADMVDRLQGLVDEGNVCRIWIKDEEGRTLIEVPMKLGLPPQKPVWSAIRALASAQQRVVVAVRRENAWPDYRATELKSITPSGGAVSERADGEVEAATDEEGMTPIVDSWKCGQQGLADATGRSRCRDIVPELIVELL